MSKPDELRRRLEGQINQGRSIDLLLVLADHLEETGDDWLAGPLREIHDRGLQPKRVHHDNGFWYYVWDRALLAAEVFAHMESSRQWADRETGRLFYRKRWDTFLALAAAMASEGEVAQRLCLGDEAFASYDFGDLVVKETGPWQEEAGRMFRPVFFENGDEPSTRATFVVTFSGADVASVELRD